MIRSLFAVSQGRYLACTYIQTDVYIYMSLRRQIKSITWAYDVIRCSARHYAIGTVKTVNETKIVKIVYIVDGIKL